MKLRLRLQLFATQPLTLTWRQPATSVFRAPELPNTSKPRLKYPISPLAGGLRLGCCSTRCDDGEAGGARASLVRVRVVSIARAETAAGTAHVAQGLVAIGRVLIVTFGDTCGRSCIAIRHCQSQLSAVPVQAIYEPLES